MIENRIHLSDPKESDSLRVSVSLLDRLMTLAGELVLSRNQLLQGIGASNMKAIELSGQRIDMITSELQEATMRTRMQPIAKLFDKFNPIVSDLGRQHGKGVELETRGREVELDKTILESIRNPLHILIENCIKHGIELPEERKKIGKKPNGRISLRAFHDAGQVHIAVSDDGCGLSLGTIPDTISAAIESLGGVIEVDSTPDQGTDVRIKLPLTLAIILSQIISVGNERYAIPQANLSELLRIPAADVKEKIAKVGDAEVVRLRGELLPLLNLPEILGIKRSYIDPATGLEQPDRRKDLADRRSEKFSDNGDMLSTDNPEQDFQQRNSKDRRRHGAGDVNIGVVFAGNYKYGLVIDQFHDSEEIVVKPVGRHLKKYKSYAGVTIMGDGKVAFILDILNLAHMAGLSTITESSQLTKAAGEDAINTNDKESLVIFKNQETEYYAAPFESVERIEKLPSSSIENIGTRKVVQYRGGALPLYELSQIIDVKPLPKREQQEVIVFKVEDKRFGLMVTPPVDTLEVELSIDDSTLKQEGIKGSMIIKGHTTLLLDIGFMRRI